LHAQRITPAPEPGSLEEAGDLVEHHLQANLESIRMRVSEEYFPMTGSRKLKTPKRITKVRRLTGRCMDRKTDGIEIREITPPPLRHLLSAGASLSEKTYGTEAVKAVFRGHGVE
jgi:hypothetical protein